MKLGDLKKVDLRKIWKHEAIDFTNWLALDKNLKLLSEELGIEIINAQTEQGVGSFNVDILAEDETERKIVIENQLEKTNHDHLGKIITYAAGHDAGYIIWIVAKARQEHEQAINWLNENTTSEANFFLVEIEAWQIGDSMPAPKFNVVAEPNDWAKTIKQSGSGNKLTETKLKQQKFWEKLRDLGEEKSEYVRSWQAPRPQHWYNIRIGSSRAKLSGLVNTRESYVGVELYVYDDKELFLALMNKSRQIESKLGFELEWQELPEKKASRALIKHQGNIDDELAHEDLLNWMLGKIDQMAKVFPSYL